MISKCSFFKAARLCNSQCLRWPFWQKVALADYLHTGAWTKRAIADAQVVGDVHVAFDGSDDGFRSIPAAADIAWSEHPVYAAYCSNNTIYGTRFDTAPDAPAPLIADMSSENVQPAHRLVKARHGVRRRPKEPRPRRCHAGCHQARLA